MKISRSTGYALLAVGYMGKNADKKIILSNEISKEYNIPLEYLLKILQQLVRANILRSKRGPRGGFSLVKPVSKINMMEVIEAVDGPMNNQLNLEEQIPDKKFTDKIEAVYGKAITQFQAVFEKTKFNTLIS
ncbi:MAG: Rrf2 family transcriptional regulator [Planctomycetes bacterium]|nr:Rrf2 family transcriptional regulator [Planctomycetota bacterium]